MLKGKFVSYLVIAFVVNGIVALVIINAQTETNSWQISFKNTGSNSSPRAADLNGDKILDIVMGAGGEEDDSSDYGVIAVNGNDESILWSLPVYNQIVGSPVFLDITSDGIVDVLIGGRSSLFYAIDGKTGKVLWSNTRYKPDMDIKRDTSLLNFFNPQFIGDVDDDGIRDLLVTFGGYTHAAPNVLRKR